MRKIYDAAVRVGEYTTRDGQTKALWKNVGAEMENDKGEHFLLLDRFFNFSMVPVEEGRDKMIISLFVPKEQQNQGGWNNQQAPQAQGQYRPNPDEVKRHRNARLGDMEWANAAGFGSDTADVPF